MDRERRVWRNGGGANPGKRRLIEALKAGGKTEFAAQRIALIMFKLFTSAKEDSIARKFIKDNAEELEASLGLPYEALRNLT